MMAMQSKVIPTTRNSGTMMFHIFHFHPFHPLKLHRGITVLDFRIEKSQYECCQLSRKESSNRRQSSENESILVAITTTSSECCPRQKPKVSLARTLLIAAAANPVNLPGQKSCIDHTCQRTKHKAAKNRFVLRQEAPIPMKQKDKNKETHL